MSDQRQAFIDAQNYFVGDGGRLRNRIRAVELLHQVCYSYPRPIPAAMRMLANCYETGESIQMDLNAAMEMYNRIGDVVSARRCAAKIQHPGSDGHSIPSDLQAHAVANRNAVVINHPQSSAPAISTASRPSPLPAHIERIVLQVRNM
jgi:hypothetical protein